MLNIKLTTIALISFTIVLFSQKNENNTYQSYQSKTIPYHLLIFKKNKLIVEVPRKDNITYGSRAIFMTYTNNDTIFICNKLNNKTIQNSLSISNPFTNQFVDSKILKKSNNELILINKNRPYFKKKLIDSLIGNNIIFCINGKFFKAPLNSNKNQINLEKYKKAKIKIWKGNKSYEKYGIIGLKGIFEISNKKSP